MAGYCLFYEATLDNEDCSGLEACPNKNGIENLELCIEDGRKKIKCLYKEEQSESDRFNTLLKYY